MKPLASNRTFPLPPCALNALNLLKQDIENSVVCVIDENLPFVVETDASDFAIAATLNQAGRHVAFFSRILQKSEMNHPAVEKEAYSIVEAIRYLKHYLTGRRFTLVTDLKSVSFMFDAKRTGKIKNDKIQRWRIELVCFNFDIQYRPGSENVPADSFSRPFCTAVSSNKLVQLHNELCHPGITRMHHYVKMTSLSVSLEEIKAITTSCRTCAECKPHFYRPVESNLIKATQPFERLSVDFKGPLPSASRNKYFLTVVDEYSRFPFAIPCSDVSTPTFIASLCSIFSIFGNPGYIHSDRGGSFMSTELKNWLHSKNIATWFSNPGSVLLKRYVRQSKYDPLVDEVELLEANPNYAPIRHPDGRESTVSLRDLAPFGENISQTNAEAQPASFSHEPYVSIGEHSTEAEVLETHHVPITVPTAPVEV